MNKLSGFELSRELLKRSWYTLGHNSRERQAYRLAEGVGSCRNMALVKADAAARWPEKYTEDRAYAIGALLGRAYALADRLEEHYR